MPAPEDASPPAPAPDPGEVSPTAAGVSWRVWALLLLLVLAVVAYGVQARHGARLAERVATLEAELADARASLDAHREHLEEVRGAVAGVRDELDALESLVGRDPESEPEPEP